MLVKTMNAFQLVRVGHGEVRKVPVPTPGPNEVLIKVHFCGICGSDVPRYFSTGAHRMPITIGHEFSGVVEQTGDNVSKILVGTRVTVAPLIPCNACEYCERGLFSLCENYGYVGSRQDGAFAEFVVVPAANCLPIPDSVTLQDAAFTDPAANAIHALWKGRISEGNIVLIFGMGTIGLFAVQWAKLLGATVVVIDRFSEKVNLAKQLGADFGFSSSSDEILSQVRTVCSVSGVDIALELSGSPVGQEFCIRAVRKQGRVVIHGISHKDLLIPEKVLDVFQRGECEFIGSWNSFSAPFPGKEWTETLKNIGSGHIRTEPIVSKICGLNGLRSAFDEYRQGIPFNKVLCSFD